MTDPIMLKEDHCPDFTRCCRLKWDKIGYGCAEHIIYQRVFEDCAACEGVPEPAPRPAQFL
jgi:hypothetical protein